jgi:hypothetical protein
MPMYRKKPVVIEAVEFRAGEQPGELAGDVVSGRVRYTEEGTILIATLEGTMVGQPGDFIIRGVKGELYPCKPEIFHATYDRVIPDKEPAPCAPEGGFVRWPLLVAFALAGILVAGVARAEEPQFGACFRAGKVCMAPRVAAPAMAVDLATGDVQFGVLPGFGYGLEYVGPKVRIGGSLLVNVRETAAGNRLAPSLMLDFMRYVHTGPMLQLGDRRWFWLLTLGTDLGNAPSAPAAAAKPGA